MKKGDKVVMLLAGCGHETASTHVITKVSKGMVTIDGVDSQTFDAKTGRPLQGEWIPGFTRRIVMLEK